MATKEYRDYGYLVGNDERLTEIDTKKYTQVFRATHEGELRLPLMNRSFISFSYGGKWIEDFNLIATTDGDRMHRNGYASFVDKVSEYDNLPGLQYLNTHYRTNTLDIKLTTDGIELKELDEFLLWFRAGEAKELILAEHPNRAILARVSEPPTLELLPFETKVLVNLSGVYYETSTTLYKGDINLNLVADQPHWYSLVNVLGIRDGNYYEDKWIDARGNKVNIFASQDALKVLYEDGLPLGSMIDTNILLGDGTYANMGNNLFSMIWDPRAAEHLPNIENLPGAGACISGTIDNITYEGVIAGAVIDASGNGIEELRRDSAGYFFYAGTAPAFTETKFTLLPVLDGSTYYISVPRNSFIASLDSGAPYNIITIQSRTQQQLIFTTPNVYSSYNKAILILIKYITTNYTWEDVRKEVRNEVRHAGVRAWAIAVLDYGSRVSGWSDNGAISASADSMHLRRIMSFFLCSSSNVGGAIPVPYPVTFTFNSETGAAKGRFQYREVTSAIADSMATWENYGLNENFREEDVGDMLRSNHIIIRDRNYATDNGRIMNWSGATEKTKSYSHCITHDIDTPLTNFSILYKNMYL